MKIQYCALQRPKPGSRAEECEDAFAVSVPFSIAAVCDGAGTAFESGLWARLLAEGFVESSPLGWTHDALLGWVDSVAAAWSQSIPWADLNHFAEEKARSGSAATLIGLQLAVPSQQATTGTWECLAIGDSCLFQVSRGDLVQALPFKQSTDFNARPPLLSTQRSINVQSIGQLVAEEGTWQDGDTFFLLTDAIAQWFLREFEQGAAPWDFLTSLDEQSFRSFVQDTQAQRLMRKDDVTAVMVGIGVPLATRQPPVTSPVPSGLAPSRSAAPQVPMPPSRPMPLGSGRGQQRSSPSWSGPPSELIGRVSDGDRMRLGFQSRPELIGHAFISYVREDSLEVDRLQEILEAAGVRVWRDTVDLWPGEDWRAKIRRAITDDALVFLACFSRKSLARKRSYQNEELALAIDQMRLRRPGESWLIPIRLDDCDIPDLDIGGGRSLSSIQRADLFGDRFDDGAARLTKAVSRILER